jgi:hypothetical protein
MSFTMKGFGAGVSTGLVGASAGGNEKNVEPVMATSWQLVSRFRRLINQQLDTVEDVDASPGKRKRALDFSTALVPQLG